MRRDFLTLYRAQGQGADRFSFEGRSIHMINHSPPKLMTSEISQKSRPETQRLSMKWSIGYAARKYRASMMTGYLV